MMTNAPKCFDCKNKVDLYGDLPICKAFKNGIPYSIFFDNDSHTKPLHNQDNDIIFEPID